MTIDELLKDCQPAMSEFVIERFTIIAHGGTPWGQYQQALRDIRTRVDANAEEASQIELLEVEAEEQEAEADTHFEEVVKRRCKIMAERCRRRAEVVRRSLAERTRELDHFVAIAAALKAFIGDVTPELRRSLEEDLAVYKIQLRVVADMLAEGRLSASTISSALCLPVALREQMFALCKDRKQAELWLMTAEHARLPELPA